MHSARLLLIAFLTVTASVAQPLLAPMLEDAPVVPEAERLENVKGKSIVVVTPHPDDEHFSMAATLSMLAKNGNTIQIIVLTNDNKGSKDLEMTRERLARIRRAEEEAATRACGIPVENLTWLGYEDGDLEYADPRVLRGEIARLLKKFRPDIVFCPDPGATWVQWHKTDHRMGANITQDAFIAAQWHLYYPQHLLDEKLAPYAVPLVYYYYSQAPNYEVDITDLFDKKVEAVAAHVSQFEPSNSKYTPDMPVETRKQLYDGLKAASMSDDRIVERFRRQENP